MFAVLSRRLVLSILSILSILTASALAPRAAHALVTGAWTGEGDATNVYYGAVVGTAGDVDGDGYSDALIGAYGGLGAVYVHHGGPGGIGDEPDWTLVGGGDFTGRHAATAGDVNADGYDDLLVGAPRYTGGEHWEGRVSLFLGGPAGLATTPVWQMESDLAEARLGTVASAGDFNGDGFDDFLVGATGFNVEAGRVWLYLGSASGIPQELFSLDAVAGDQLGTDYAAGDIDGDGLSDIVVGAPGGGYVRVLYGYEQGLPNTLTLFGPNGTDGEFGFALTTAGDVTLDGYTDIVVGGPRDAVGGEIREGVVYLFRGTADGLATSPVWTYDSDVPFAQLGRAVACVGDVNGDGRPDLAVGAPFLSNGNGNEGRAYLFYGSPAGYEDEVLAWTTESDQDAANMGFALGTPGDVNGDGFADLIAAAPLFDDPEFDEGRVALYHGGADMPTHLGAYTEHDQEYAEYGSAVALGDLDGDGYDDHVVGTGLYDVGGATDAGRLWVYPGQPGLAATVPTQTVDLGTALAEFGASLAGVHDVDGDGHDALLVGAPGTDGDEGAVHLFLGSAAGIGVVPDWTAVTGDGGRLGHAVASAGDVDGDGYPDVLVGAPLAGDGGAAYVYRGGPAGLPDQPDWEYHVEIPGALFGWAVAAVGDVDGDGYGEIAVGAPGFPVAGGTGQVLVFFGGPTGISDREPWQGGDASPTGETGFAVAGGDLDGDGLADLVIGAPGWDEGLDDRGRVAVHLSDGASLAATAAWIRLGGGAGGRLGHAVAVADLDLDGHDDVLAGQPYVDNGQTEEGQVLALRPADGSLAWAVDGNAPLAWHGRAIASAGDVNGDGFPDVLTGAPGLESPLVHEGAAYLWLGNGGYLGRLYNIIPGVDRHVQVRTIESGQLVGLHGTVGTMQPRVTTRGRTPLGRSDVALEVEVKRAGVPFDGQGTDVTPLVDTGPPDAQGSVVDLAISLAGLGDDTPYRWRARVLSPDVLAKRSPWFTDPGNNVSETDFRTGTATAVAEDTRVGVGPSLVLSFAARPVPFSGTSTIRYELARAGRVSVTVYDLAGRRVAVLERGFRPVGVHEVAWHGRSGAGRPVASGVYFGVIEALGERHVQRLVVAR